MPGPDRAAQCAVVSGTRMKNTLALLLPLVLLAACETTPDQQASSSARPERVCTTGSNICGRASPTDVLSREDIRQGDVLPSQRTMQ